MKKWTMAWDHVVPSQISTPIPSHMLLSQGNFFDFFIFIYFLEIIIIKIRIIIKIKIIIIPRRCFLGGDSLGNHPSKWVMTCLCVDGNI